MPKIPLKSKVFNPYEVLRKHLKPEHFPPLLELPEKHPVPEDESFEFDCCQRPKPENEYILSTEEGKTFKYCVECYIDTTYEECISCSKHFNLVGWWIQDHQIPRNFREGQFGCTSFICYDCFQNEANLKFYCQNKAIVCPKHYKKMSKELIESLPQNQYLNRLAEGIDLPENKHLFNCDICGLMCQCFNPYKHLKGFQKNYISYHELGGCFSICYNCAHPREETLRRKNQKLLKKNRKLQKQIEHLQAQIKYQPGGSGAQEAQKDFQTHIQNQPNDSGSFRAELPLE